MKVNSKSFQGLPPDGMGSACVDLVAQHAYRIGTWEARK